MNFNQAGLKALFKKILDSKVDNYEDMITTFGDEMLDLLPSGKVFQPEDFWSAFSFKDATLCTAFYGPLFTCTVTGTTKIIDGCEGIVFRGYCSMQNAILPLGDKHRISPNQIIGSASIVFAYPWMRTKVNYREFFNREAFCVYPERFTLADIGQRKTQTGKDKNGNERKGWNMVNLKLLDGSKPKLLPNGAPGKEDVVIKQDALNTWFMEAIKHDRYWIAMCTVLPTWEVAILYGFVRQKKYKHTDHAEKIIGVMIANCYYGEYSNLERKIKDKFSEFNLGTPIVHQDGGKYIVSGRDVYDILGDIYVLKNTSKYPLVDDITKRDMNTPFAA